MQFLTTLHVGIPLDSQLTQTADAPYVLTGDKPAHPKNHFGTAIALEKLQQIAQKYFNTTNDENNPTEQKRKLKINDISLVRGGVFDLNLNWVGDNQNDPHWGHRTGTEVDIETKDSLGNDTSCTSVPEGNDLVKEAVEAVIREELSPTTPQGTIPLRLRRAYKCESEGRNHVYLQ